MNISPADLDREYIAAIDAWPFIPAVEARHGLPPMLLMAVGSRETNLTDEVGDGGHGHGVWQLDDRSHTIPNPLPVDQQADIAASILRGLLDHFSGHREPALAAYNAGVGGVERVLGRGQPPDAATTGGDYSADVLARMAYLQTRFPAPTPTTPQENDMTPVVDTKAQGFDGLIPNWEADENGNTYAWNGARPLPTLNSITPNHPPIVAVGCHPSGDGIILYGNDRRQEAGKWVRSTYEIVAH